MKKHILRLHWKLFIPLIGLLWLIIGITICYFVMHEKQRQKENLENRLLNVNNTVIDAYNHGTDLQKTVDFIKLFTDKTTLAPLRITVYDNNGRMIADNPAETIRLYGDDGKADERLIRLLDDNGNATIQDMVYDDSRSMVSSKMSQDGRIYSFAALPYEGAVLDFLRIDPMVWLVVIALGLLSSLLAFLGIRAICQNVYTLRDYARAIADDKVPDEISTMHFSNDELGDVSRNLLNIYREKIHAEKEKNHHERQIAMNITHELNTPVSIVKGYIDTVLETPDMPEETRQHFLLRAKQNADRLATLVNDVSMVMRLQENNDKVELTPVDMHQLGKRIAEDIVQGHIAENMSFTYDIPEGCIVMGHESLLTNALLNLIYNSARHSDGTAMTLRWLRKEDGHQVFSFKDNGKGVDDEHIERLFDMFYRVDYGRSRKKGGNGLGLPLVLRILKSMDGDISVSNSADGGLEFTITLLAAD